VREYRASSGRILDHLRCEITLGGRQVAVSLSLHRIHAGANLAVFEDVTRLVEQERQLYRDQQRFRAIFDNVRDYAIFTVDAAGRVDGWNHSLQRFGGWREADVVGQPLDIFLPPELRDAEAIEAVLAKARRIGSVETEGWRLRQDGARLWANSVLTALPDSSGAVRGFVVVSRDMTERKRIEDELRRLATTDPLTGAFNRRHGQARLVERLAAWRGDGPRPAVLMLDIDHFKSINDHHGHDAGDAALCAAVEACRVELGEEGAVARWGGEEFLINLPATDALAAVEIAERLREAIRRVRVPTGHGEIGMTVSIGVALAVQPTDAPEGLVHRADVALYTAKEHGRDRVVLAA
jgi:diguanylate cyclase (GGDEF)-like protein/PAS domain S-box-containing protein